MRALIGTILLASAGAAFGMTYFLTDQWVKNGDRFCKYGNGTILNVGVSMCPMSIKA